MAQSPNANFKTSVTLDEAHATRTALVGLRDWLLTLQADQMTEEQRELLGTIEPLLRREYGGLK